MKRFLFGCLYVLIVTEVARHLADTFGSGYAAGVIVYFGLVLMRPTKDIEKL